MRLDTRQRRRGTILPLMAIGIVALVGCVALAVDVGMVALARNQCQNAADVAAITALRTLNGDSVGNYGQTDAVTNGIAAAGNQNVLSAPVASSQVTMKLGTYGYNTTNNTFSPQVEPSGTTTWNTLAEATVNYTRYYSFARVFGLTSIQVSAKARAVHRPRDVALVLDFSGSMNNESDVWNNEGYLGNGGGGANMSPNNADTRVPMFGCYDCGTSFSMPRYANVTGQAAVNPSLLVQTASDARIGKCNVTQAALGLDAMAGDYYQDAASMSYTTKAFTAAPDSQMTNPGGDIPLRKGGRLSDSAAFADKYVKTAFEIVYDQTTIPTGSDARLLKEHLAWKSEGYDLFYGKDTSLSVAQWNADGSAGAPRTVTPDPAPKLRPQPATGTGTAFKGFTVGPAFWGATFFIWPPDPRDPVGYDMSQASYRAGDWRKRFFIATGTGPQDDFANGVTENTKLYTNNTTAFTGDQENNTTGKWLDPVNGSTTNYRINYRAILRWLQQTNVFPPQLRAGRVLFYDAIPDNVPDGAYTWTTLNRNITWADQNQRFWKEYIDYVIGVWRDPMNGVNRPGMPACSLGPDFVWTSTPGNTASISGKPTAYGTDSAYMNYGDRPRFPRHRFWFGPMTMIQFLSDTGNLPGTARDISTFSLKLGVQAAFQDMRSNYPNTKASLAMFCRPHFNGEGSEVGKFSVPQVALTDNYNDLINGLWYPPGSTSTNNIRLWDPQASRVPRAFGDYTGNTASFYGFVMAHNQLSSSATARSQNIGGSGRRGSDRLVLFETDGMANVGGSAPYQSSESYYDVTFDPSGPTVTTQVTSGGDAKTTTYTVVDRMVSQEPTGFARPNLPVTIHCIAFGAVMEDNAPAGDKADIVSFLNTVAGKGGTVFPNSATDANDGYKWVLGDQTQRRDRLRTSILKALRSGVRIALIQ